MEKIKSLTYLEQLEKMLASVATMSQEQIDVCAWAMGAVCVGWNRTTITERLNEDICREKTGRSYVEVL